MDACGGVIVEDGIDDLAGRHDAFHGIEEADKFAMLMLRHAAPEDGAVQDIEPGEQRGDAVAFVVVRQGTAFAGLGGWFGIRAKSGHKGISNGSGWGSRGSGRFGHIENEPAEAVNMLTDQWPSWGVRKRVRRGIRAERLF